MTSGSGRNSREFPSQVVELAASALSEGQLIAIPTDTVYGLAVLPGAEGATQALFALKGRPASLELPVIVKDAHQADALASGGLSVLARSFAERFWPGAVTLVMRRRSGIDWLLGGDSTTIGVRCPAAGIVGALCSRLGPLATTSANVHGEPPLTTAEEIRGRFGDQIALFIDGGRLDGPPSTVVDVRGARLRCLREGAVSFAEIERFASSAVGELRVSERS